MYLFKNNQQNEPVPTAKKRFSTVSVLIGLAALAALTALIWFFGVPYTRYLSADKLMSEGAYYSASEAFSALDGFYDSDARRDECYYLLGVDALASGDARSATSYYFRMTDKGTSALFKTQLYDYAASALERGSNEDVMELFSGVLSDYSNALELWTRACYAEAEEYYNTGFYSVALEYYRQLPESYEDSAEKTAACLEAAYNEVFGIFEVTGTVPDGTSYLSGYKDYDNFVVLSKLNASVWDTPEDEKSNLELIYSLGDFKDVRRCGFLTERLYGHRWEANGNYFEYLEGGISTKPQFNFPAYSLEGYYGLYFKFFGDSLYTGSDVADSWTKQLTFEFDDMDDTLYVTSVMTGERYKLQKVL